MAPRVTCHSESSHSVKGDPPMTLEDKVVTSVVYILEQHVGEGEYSVLTFVTGGTWSSEEIYVHSVD